MDKFYKAKFALLLLLAGLFATQDSHAEGSKDLYPSGALGGRACLVSTNATKAGWSLTNTGVHYAYVKAGETIGAASSAQGIGSGQLVFTAPDGTVYSSTVGSTTVGQIANRTAEIAGPWSGYTPFTRVAGAGQTGLWKVEFLSTLPSNQITEGAGANWTADESWTQNASSSAICAWDVSVRNAAAVIQTGRVYTNVLNMYVQHNDYRAKLYVLTNDGYLFKVNNNGLDGLGFVGFVNNKGLTKSGKDTDPPLYKSKDGTAYNTDIYTWDPRADDGVYSVTHKMFYQVPDATLPASAPMPGSKTTWLNVPKVIPTISNISVDGVEGTSGQVSSKGAYIKFDANTIGTYRITLEGSGSFVTRKITGTAAKGSNSIFWDGKDGAGVTPSLGVANVVAKVQLQGSEIHFPFIDVETNSNGLIIEQLKDDHVTVENDIVYWADSTFTGAAGVASSPLINGNEGSGISSNSNGHKWGLDFGNNRTMDTWTYILGDIASKNTSLSIIRADLAIQSVGPAVGGTTQTYQGQPIDYRVVVVNNGPSDVTGAPFAIKVPAGFTIASVSDVTYTTSCGTVNSAALTGGNYSALLDLPNGCTITFTFKGTPSTTGAINIETSIMRPKDVTDPDATNPDATVPPTDPHLECKNGGTTENCNNIKYSSTVTSMPNVNIVVNKTTTATNYTPGGTVQYTFTVTNTSTTSVARNVRVTDNAPAGTTIGSWTAAFTTGTGTLPAASGTGNIDQTIVTLPANTVVTYTVTVNVPAAFTGSLQNTASASSADDVVTGDNTSTTPPITVVPRANLRITKLGNPSFVPGGAAAVYYISLDNIGPDAATNVNVVDNLPTGATGMSWTASASGTTLPATSGTGSINQIIPVLGSGRTVNYTVTVTTPSSYNAALTNRATVTSDVFDPVLANNGSQASIPPARQSDIAVVKSTTATTFAPGEDVTYTFTVTNNGPSDGSNVSVTDNAPTGTTIKSWTAAVTTGTATLPGISGTGNINETITELPFGSVVTYTVVLATASDFTGNLSNTATATNATDPTATNNSSTTTGITPTPKANIAVVKSTAATTFAPGEDVTYTITITNNGPSDATNVSVTDNAPTGTTISSWTATASSPIINLPTVSGTGDINEGIPVLPSGAVVTYTVVVSTPSSFTGNLVNTANANSADVTDPVITDNTSTSTLTPTLKADIAVVKTTTSTSFAPGEAVVYTIKVSNNGPSDASDVVVIDNAPAGTTITGWNAMITRGVATLPVTSGTGNINQTISKLANGAEVTYNISVSTPASFTGNLSNTASASSPATDPTPGNNSSTTTGIAPSPKADIAITKFNDFTAFAPGEDVQYIIRVTNNGPSDAANVNVIDNAPTGTTIKSWTAAVKTGTVTLPAASGTGNINETIANVPNGAVVEYIVIVSTQSTFTGNLRNTASTSSDATDPVSTNNSSTTTDVTPTPRADIGVGKSTAATTFTPGEDVTYTIGVVNAGPSAATNVVVTDNAPAGTTIKSWSVIGASGSVTVPNMSGVGNINETIPSMPGVTSVVYQVVVSVPAGFTGATLSNTASGSSDVTDDIPLNNTSTTSNIPSAAKADIAVVKSTTATSFAPGEDVTYTITVTNNGPSDAANVVVTDNAPTGTNIKSWTAAVTTGIVTLPAASGTGNINETITKVPNGAVVTYTVVVATPASFTANLSNTASGSSDATDPVPANNNSTTTSIAPAPKADIAVVKSTTATSFAPGEDVTYTITVTNNGPSDAANVVVTDNAPVGTTIKSWSAAVTTGTVTLPAASGTGNINQTITKVPNGAVVTYTVVVSTPANFTANLSNTAAGSSDATDPVPANNNSTTTGITPSPKADIAVVKSTTATTFAPGEDVTYTITVTNNGPSDADNVIVIDNAPAGTTIKSWTAAVTTGTVTLPAASGTGNINQTITKVPNGAVVTYTVVITTPASFTANLSNTAAGSSDATDPVPANNNSTTTGIAPSPKADIAVVKSTTATSFAPGEDVTYTITVTNNGPSDAANVVVADNAPTGTTIKSWSAAVTTGTVTLPAASGTGNINETITKVPNGAVVTYTVVVSTPASFTANLSNTAAGSSDATDPAPANNNSTTTGIAPAPKADIAVVKSTTATSFAPGEDVTYTITVTNNGPSDAANVVVSDNAPVGTTIKSWTAAVTTGTVTLPAASGTGNINQTITKVPNGAVVTYTVVVSTPANFTANLSNTAAGSSDATDLVPANNNSTTTGIVPAPKADIAVVKSTTATTFAPGEDVTYTITVSNNGPSDAANVVVSDNAPVGTTIKSWTAAVTNGTVALPAASGTGNINQTIAKVPNGAVVTYTVVVATPASFTANLSNTASGSSDATDPTPANNSSTTTGITPSPKADMAVVKATTATTFAPGEDVTYTITVSNNGPSDAANVKVTDNAPTGTIIKSWTAAVTTGTVTLPATSGSGNISQTIAKVPAAAVVTYTVVVSTTSGFTGNLSNTATVSSDATDNTPANNTSTTTGIAPSPKADIAVVKATTATNFAPGEDVTYTITVSNNGPSDAANVKVIDNAPTGTTIKSWTAAVKTGTVTLPAVSGTGNISQTIAKVPNGAAVTYTVIVATPASFNGNLSNTASGSSDATDNTPGNNTSTTPGITPSPKADIAVVKATTATTFAPGEDVTYTITVTNNGPSDAANVKVIDNAPTGTTIKSWTAAVKTGTVTLPAASGTGNISQTIAKVPNGAAVTYTVVVSTPASFTANLSNTASGSSDATDPTPANNSSTTTGITPSPKADIAVVKATTATNYVPGEDVTYTITVTNNGPSDAANVKVLDNAPTGTTIKSWTAAVKTGTVTLPAASGTGNISQTIAKVPNGAAVTYTVIISTPASFTANLSNTASGSSDATDNVPANNSSTTTGIPAAPKADITVVKATTATTFAPGEDVTYTITVTNNGPSDAANVKVIDNAPTGTTIKSWTAAVKTGTVTLPAASGTGNISQTIAKVPNGAAVTYTVIVSTPASFTGNLSNTASGSSDATDNTPGNNTSTTPGITPLPKADIAVVKSTTATTFAPGEDVTYTITVTNNGPSDAANVKVIDNAPTGTTIKSWTAAVKTGTVTLPAASGTGNISQTIAKVPNGAAVTYTVVVSTPANFTANLSNTASATSDATDNTPGNNTSTTTGLTPTAKADVEVVKTLKNAAQTTFKPGEDVFYYITIKNNGPSDAKNVNVKDVAPAGTTIFYWGVNILNGTVSLPNRNGNTDINETVALLPAGAVIRYEVGVKVHADHTGNLTNTATISSTTTDAVPGNNTSTSPVLTDAAKADVVVSKKLKNATQTSAVAGVPLEYVITVTNNGPDAAALVKVKDAAPAGTMISTWVATAINGTPDIADMSGTGDVDAVINHLPSGAIVAYNVTVVVPGDYSAATISNTAVVSSQTADPVTTNNSSTTPALPIVGEADLQISKATTAQDYVPGRTLEYTIDVTNVGPSVAKSVNVKDIAPAGTSISAWTATVTNGTVTLPANNGAGDLDQTITVMAVNAVVRYNVTVSVPVDFRGDISNTATVATTTTDKDQTNNSSTTAVLKPVQSADLEVTKQLKDPSQKNFVAGKDVVYLITVKNNGPAPATKVNIKDQAPAGTTIGSWTATVTNGTVTLPNASGTGDLNETIAMMPDQSVVTYEVVVKTPDTYQGALVNTVDVSSETSDPAPTCAACTAPAVAADPLPEADTDDYGNVRADNPVTIPVLKNDKPGDNNTPLDPKSVEIVTQPAHGTVVVNEDGTIVYTPTPGYNGPDSFTYRVQDQNGSWSNVATVNMNIVPDEVTVPNVITPNGDGANDKLEIKGLNKFVQNEIIIYNRWNNVLYKKQNYQGEWDGQGLNAGTYYYTLKGLDANGQWHTYNGYIMLLR